MEDTRSSDFSSRDTLEPMASRFGYERVTEGEHVIGLQKARLKKFLEMRGADCGPAPFLNALGVGLLYDEQSLKGALDIIHDWINEDRDMLRHEIPKHGLQVPFPEGLLQHVAQDVVKLAKERRQSSSSTPLPASMASLL